MTNEESYILSKCLEHIKTGSCFFQLPFFPFQLGNVINKVNLFSQNTSVWATEQKYGLF